jgi:hypothetical protein
MINETETEDVYRCGLGGGCRRSTRSLDPYTRLGWQLVRTNATLNTVTVVKIKFLSMC